MPKMQVALLSRGSSPSSARAKEPANGTLLLVINIHLLVIDFCQRMSFSARAARRVFGDAQNRRQGPIAWLPVLFIMTRTSTEGKLRWHVSAPYSSGRLGGPINNYKLSSANSAIHGSDTFERANIPSDTMHGITDMKPVSAMPPPP